MASHGTHEYRGFEQGPIRPPSEAHSLLIRLTRNCPWNKCAFCPVYKGSSFSLRSEEHIYRDIDALHTCVTALKKIVDSRGKIDPEDFAQFSTETQLDRIALNAALHWMSAGMQAIFLQDANSLIIQPERLIRILGYLRDRFPWVQRITSYARSHTIARIESRYLALMKQNGLSRIHIGMESGSNAVLALVQKGADQKTHILAGKKVKDAGMELSEYVMPGLGGVSLSRQHAEQTANALNQINPDFIRLRTLALPAQVELAKMQQRGEFIPQTDRQNAEELLVFLDNLHGITSYLASDHSLNLFEDLQGRLPEDMAKMRKIVQDFLELSPHEQMLYQVGRRIGYYRGLADFNQDVAREKIQEICYTNSIHPGNVDAVVSTLMKRFI